MLVKKKKRKKEIREKYGKIKSKNEKEIAFFLQIVGSKYVECK